MAEEIEQRYDPVVIEPKLSEFDKLLESRTEVPKELSAEERKKVAVTA